MLETVVIMMAFLLAWVVFVDSVLWCINAIFTWYIKRLREDRSYDDVTEPDSEECEVLLGERVIESGL